MQWLSGLRLKSLRKSDLYPWTLDVGLYNPRHQSPCPNGGRTKGQGPSCRLRSGLYPS